MTIANFTETGNPAHVILLRLKKRQAIFRFTLTMSFSIEQLLLHTRFFLVQIAGLLNF